MRFPGPKNPKNWQNLQRVAKLGLKDSPNILRAISLLLSHSGYPRPATRANSSRSEADARRHVRRRRSGRGYAKKVRAVPAWLKRQAYAEYEITQYKTGDYEVDHLIALSLGGSNSIRNLWPESTKTTPWNSYVKDALEWKLHKLVCAGQLDL
jgi:hypothetical protein